MNAGGGGGDLNIQRGEWIGYGRGHGIRDVDKNGRAGHLMNVPGGTLFVDEFAALSQELQVVFLSVLDGRAIEKIGGDSFEPKARCVFATNANIPEAVAKGVLRRDLIDRIAVTIPIPPLRDRRGDILLLAKHFAAGQTVSERCLVALLRHNWPGNIREIQKVIGNALARMKGENASRVDLDHLDLDADILAEAKAMDDDACRRHVWSLADEIARNEGFVPGKGLQRRAGEIMGVGEAAASKIYQALGLNGIASV